MIRGSLGTWRPDYSEQQTSTQIRMVAGFVEVVEREETLVAEVGFEPPTFPAPLSARGQRKAKRGAFSWVGAGPQAAAMRLDDRPANGEPHAGALGLRGKECAEDLVQLFRRE